MSKRIQQVNQLIKKELSQIILREFEFPLDVFVTLTRVETSADLKNSNVWISVFPVEMAEKIIDFLNRKIFFLQQKINQRLKMKPIPKIIFLKEEKTEKADRIEKILEKLKKDDNSPKSPLSLSGNSEK